MKTPRIELLTPELDTSILFIPGYDLYSENLSAQNAQDATPEQIAAIALALWENSGEQIQQPARSVWALAQQEFYRGA